MAIYSPPVVCSPCDNLQVHRTSKIRSGAPHTALPHTLSAAVYGIDADLVDIEVDITPTRGESEQATSVTIVGLPDAAVRESRERIRAAIRTARSLPFQKPQSIWRPPMFAKKAPALICQLHWEFSVRMATSLKKKT